MGNTTAKHCLPALLILALLTSPLFLSTHSRATAMPTAGVTERVSASSSGEQANYSSAWPSISADGRFVAFTSYASNLVSEDTNRVGDIFVHDRQTGVTELVSVTSSGEQGSGDSGYQSISADGRFVAFDSYASNLVSGDTNGSRDIFVHDRQTGVTELVSVSSNGEQGNHWSESPSISADGRFVAYHSYASNLVSGDTNGSRDIFVHDRQTGVTELVSVSSNSEQGCYDSYEPSITADGRFVAFVSGAPNLVSGDTNERADIFVHDRQTGVTEQISVSSDGMQGNQSSAHPSITADGRFVAFDSDASNLVSGDTNGYVDIFVHDRQTGVTERVSVSSSGEQGNGHSGEKSSITADGRFVAFRSAASNLVNGDTNIFCFPDSNGISENCPDVFIHDRQTGVTELVSVSSSGEQGNEWSVWSSISADGRFVAFDSYASNLVSGDTNGIADVFVHDRCPGGSCGVSYVISGRIVDTNGASLADVTVSVLRPDGSVVASGRTGSDGGYRISGPAAGEYRLIPNKISHRFIPDALTVQLYQDVAGQNFVGTFVSCGETTTLARAAEQGLACMIPFADPFLELPVDYTNFGIAAMGNEGAMPGKINSWFDHTSPNYAGVGGMVHWTGKQYPSYPPDDCAKPRAACYDGHDGIDFQHNYAVPDEPLYPAASGVVKETCHRDQANYPGELCDRGASLGKYLLIDHENGYATFYAHLDSIQDWVREGTRVYADSRPVIGIMGGTGGWPVHLHFVLYFDTNSDEKWTQNEVVDPYGWQPIDEKDPWNVPSLYLWKHPLYTSSSISAAGGVCTGPGDELRASIPAGMSDGSLICSAGSAPTPAQPGSALLRIIGSFFVDLWRMVFPSLGNSVFDLSTVSAGSYSLNIAYSPEALAHLDVSKLQIFHWDESGAAWTALPTSLDEGQQRASAQTNLTGNFTLQAPLICPADTAEPFNDAPAFEVDFPQTSYPLIAQHLFDIAGDEDWTAFTAEAGQTYTLQTEALAAGVDTVLQLYGGDGVTELAADDNGAEGNASHLVWTAPESGVYQVRVTQAAGSAYGCSSGYDLRIAKAPNSSKHLFLPFLTR